jgi:predicted TPR repeat methyltransferase
VLEIGSGAGVFARLIEKHVVALDCVEVSAPMVKTLRKTTKATIHHADVSAVAQWENKFDLVVALGVHYLFRDHATAMADIAKALNLGGYFYLESNVFQDMKGYVGEKFKTKEERFLHNPMIAYWFTPQLLIEQLKKHFSIVDCRNIEYGGSLVRGFLCKKRDQ